MTTALTVSATPEAREYLMDIAQEMVDRFGIDLDEAVGRIDEWFDGRSLVEDGMVSMLTHEEPDAWACHVYYGRSSYWWMQGAPPMPRPYPGNPNRDEGF